LAHIAAGFLALSLVATNVSARAQPVVAPVATSDTGVAASDPARPVLTPVATAIGLLLEKAQFWYEKGRPDVALDFYNRVLSLRPDNADALVGASKVSLDLGKEIQAKAYVTVCARWHRMIRS
jgi:tetratricopeptide (TPR) repeat protein